MNPYQLARFVVYTDVLDKLTPIYDQLPTTHRYEPEGEMLWEAIKSVRILRDDLLIDENVKQGVLSYLHGTPEIGAYR